MCRVSDSYLGLSPSRKVVASPCRFLGDRHFRSGLPSVNAAPNRHSLFVVTTAVRVSDEVGQFGDGHSRAKRATRTLSAIPPEQAQAKYEQGAWYFGDSTPEEGVGTILGVHSFVWVLTLFRHGLVLSVRRTYGSNAN